MKIQSFLVFGRFDVGMALVGALLCCPALAINKCMENNKTIYQELPCEQSLPTVAQDLVKKARYEVLHRMLDGLLASGVGVKSRSDQKRQEPVPAQAVNAVAPTLEEDDKFQSQPRSRANREARQAQSGRNSYQDALEKNAKTSERLQKDYDEMVKLCSGKTFKNPVIGMTDEQFRMCTLPNRLGAIEKWVVADDKGVPLRLYLSPTQPASRVYTIGGIVTAVKP